MTTRVRLLSNGKYVAEHATLIFFWSSCYYKYSYEYSYRCCYDTEKDATDAAEKYRKAAAKNCKRKEAAKAYKIKVTKWVH